MQRPANNSVTGVRPHFNHLSYQGNMHETFRGPLAATPLRPEYNFPLQRLPFMQRPNLNNTMHMEQLHQVTCQDASHNPSAGYCTPWPRCSPLRPAGHIMQRPGNSFTYVYSSPFHEPYTVRKLWPGYSNKPATPPVQYPRNMCYTISKAPQPKQLPSIEVLNQQFSSHRSREANVPESTNIELQRDCPLKDEESGEFLNKSFESPSVKEPDHLQDQPKSVCSSEDKQLGGVLHKPSVSFSPEDSEQSRLLKNDVQDLVQLNLKLEKAIQKNSIRLDEQNRIITNAIDVQTELRMRRRMRRMRIYLLARRNLLWDILRLPSSRRAALGLYVILTL